LANDNAKFDALFKSAPNDGFSVRTFDSGNEGAGDLSITLLQEPIDLSPAATLSLLWARNFVFQEGWVSEGTENSDQMWISALAGPYMRDEFLNFVQDGEFSPVDPPKARSEVKHLMHMVEFDTFRNDGSRYRRFSTWGGGNVSSAEGVRTIALNTPPAQAFEVYTKWNQKSYFIETPTDFFYVEWITSV